MITELSESVHRPGRLGDPTMCMRDDPRSDPRMIAALAPATVRDIKGFADSL